MTRTPSQNAAIDAALSRLDALMALRRKNPGGFPRSDVVTAVMNAALAIDRNTPVIELVGFES